MKIYEINNSGYTPSCLPSDLDMSDLINITTVNDGWMRYMNAKTGEIHDGSVYYAQMINQAKQNMYS